MLEAFFLLNGSLRTFLNVLLVAYFIFAPGFLFSKLKVQAEYLNRQNEIEYYGVIELWNVDTFEGGSVARSLWLQKRSMEIEKAHPGTFIIVRNMTKDQAILNLENGNKPTLISYGIGFGSVVLPYLTNYTGTVNVRDDLLKGGMINNTIYALPYILGGYAVIANEVLLQNLEVGENLLEAVLTSSIKKSKTTIPSLSIAGAGNTNASLALYFNAQNKVSENASISEEAFSLDAYSAYEQFVLKNSSTFLLGTQRDVYRCNNRQNNHTDEQYTYLPLGGFSDLIQYISIFETDAATKEMCEAFLSHITNEKTQKTLSSIYMFNVCNQSIYTDVFYKEWESVLLNELKTFPVFLDDANIQNKIEVATKALYNNKEAIKEINKWF